MRLIQERINLKALVDSPSHSSSQSNNRQFCDRKKQYKYAHKRVRTSARNDKRTYAENIVAEAERAVSRGDFKTVYMLTKKLPGAQTNTCHFIEDKSGQLLTNQVDVQTVGVNISWMF